MPNDTNSWSSPAAPALDAATRAQVLERLNDIVEADPLQYRRQEIQKRQGPHLSLSLDDLREIANLQDVLAEPTFVSYRPILGPFIVLYKKFTFRFFKKWLQISLGKQLEINQRLLNLAITVHVLENKLHSLEKSIQDRS